MSDPTDTRADSAREQILRAAAHQFARRSYSLVSLDDILADAQVTKGAMYFHFRSKHALAVAIVDDQAEQARAAINELVGRGLTALETIVDIVYLLAMRDLTDEAAKASRHLVESIGRTDGLLERLVSEWVKGFAQMAQKAIDEGDAIGDRHPEDLSRYLVSLYLGLRQTSDLDNIEQFLTNLEKTWQLALPGIANPDRLEYLRQFVHRRSVVAIRRLTR